MDFNWGADNAPSLVLGTTYLGGTVLTPTNATTSFTNLQYYGFSFSAQLPPNYNQATNVLTATQANETYSVNYNDNISATAGEVVDFRWLHSNSSGGVIQSFDVNSYNTTGVNFNYTGAFQVIMNIGDTLQPQFKTSGGTVVQQVGVGEVTFVQSISAITTNVILQTLRGELGQWEFLKGLLTMFNLVTLPDEDNPSNIKIEPYNDVFIPTGTAGTTLADRGITHDWTEKVDVSEMKLMPLTNLNKKTIFKFVEDEDDFAFMNYKRQIGGHLYGSKKYDASEFTILAGEDEIIAEPFAATVVKPLMSQYSDLITPAIYSYNSDDDTSEGFDNSPRIMFNNGKKTTVFDYFIPAQNGLASQNLSTYLQFSHLTNVPTLTGTRDFNFGECQLIQPVGSPVNDNLFNLYWLPYYSELYNPDTRIMTIKVNLSPSDINTFKFNDTIFIRV